MWCLGVILYRMMCGAYPFPVQTCKGNKGKLFPGEVLLPSWLSLDARDLITGLLDKDQERRLTIRQVKCHSFFARVDWDDVLNLTAGASVRKIDIDVGTCVADAMHNFNMKRVDGMSCEDRVTDEVRKRLGEEAEESVPLLNVKVGNEVIGFEYGGPVVEETEAQAVAVIQGWRSRRIWKMGWDDCQMFRKFTRDLTTEPVTCPEVLQERDQ